MHSNRTFDNFDRAVTSWCASNRAQTLSSAWRRHSSLSHDNDFTPATISLKKVRLETNSTVVWLYAVSVSLLLPDVGFGTVSQKLCHIQQKKLSVLLYQIHYGNRVDDGSLEKIKHLWYTVLIIKASKTRSVTYFNPKLRLLPFLKNNFLK